jgi:phosphate transport system substrate-binding protein
MRTNSRDPSLAGIVLAVAAALGGCSRGAGAATQRESAPIVVTGSSTIAPVLAEIGKRFEALNPTLRVDVQSGGSGRGVADLLSRTSDVGMVSRSLSSAEAADLVGHVFARDGVCVIVHAANPITRLEEPDIVKVYRGEIRSWKELGGSDAPITVVNKAEGRSTLELFLHHFGMQNKDIRADVVIGENEQAIKTVIGNPNAIAYVSIGTAEYDREHGVPIKLLPLNGIAASLDNVANGTFPLSRPLILAVRRDVRPEAQMLLDFAQSKESHAIIREQSFVPEVTR